MLARRGFWGVGLLILVAAGVWMSLRYARQTTDNLARRMAPNAPVTVLRESRTASGSLRADTDEAPVEVPLSKHRLPQTEVDDPQLMVPGLVAQLSDHEFSVRLAAGMALLRLGSNASPAVPMIERLLESEPQKVHDVMLKVLENCMSEAQAAVPALRQCLASTNVSLRTCCARTLWLLDSSEVDAARSVAKDSLTEPDPGARIEAASLLWQMDNDPAQIVPVLAGLLSDTEHAYDYRTIKLLGQLGPAAKDAIPAIEHWLKSGRTRDAYVINAAVESLDRMRDAQ